ncbi:MAG: DUF1080 domain-containing protein [Proteobacteria bacterium]|nr:DUF1080 domain-containing protein [Pseudomonadota bacterium]
MQPRIILLMMALVMCACAQTRSTPANPEIEDLTRWRQFGEPVWRFVPGGVEAGPGEQTGYLVSRVSYGDFRLRAEFWIEDETNSGIFWRCKEPASATDINPNNCYEANIWDNHPNQDSRTGSIVTLATAEVRVDTLGRWNQYEIVASGTSIRVTLNGQKVASIENDRAAGGYLALQYAGKALLRFRNVEVEAL